jgi:hypothetical protein
LIQLINPQRINNSCGKINPKKISPGSPSNRMRKLVVRSPSKNV